MAVKLFKDNTKMPAILGKGDSIRDNCFRDVPEHKGSAPRCFETHPLNGKGADSRGTAPVKGKLGG